MGPGFESLKAHQWPVGQAVKTAASHAANMGSIPVRVTIFLNGIDNAAITDIILTVEKTVRREKPAFSLLTFFSKESTVGVD